MKPATESTCPASSQVNGGGISPFVDHELVCELAHGQLMKINWPFLLVYCEMA